MTTTYLVLLGIVFIFAFMLGYNKRRKEEGKLKDLIDTPIEGGYYYQKNKEMLNLLRERNIKKDLVD